MGRKHYLFLMIIFIALIGTLFFEKSNSATLKIDKSKNIFIYSYTNTSLKNMNLTFRTGQSYDYVIYEGSEEVYKYGQEHYLFPDVYSSFVLKKGKKIESEITVPKLPPGAYVIKVWSVADELGPNKSKAQMTFSIDK
jgi:hypothetical protein